MTCTHAKTVIPGRVFEYFLFEVISERRSKKGGVGEGSIATSGAALPNSKGPLLV
jgi:hypothetical protein